MTLTITIVITFITAVTVTIALFHYLLKELNDVKRDIDALLQEDFINTMKGQFDNDTAFSDKLKDVIDEMCQIDTPMAAGITLALTRCKKYIDNG